MILLNDFKAQWEVVGPTALAAVDRVGRSGHLVLGQEVERFEAALAARWGMPHATGCASGLDALEIALRCLDLRPGQRVLTSPLSAFATTLAIVRAGGVPVFVDVDGSGLLDLERCEAALAGNRDIRFLVPVHLYGHALDRERLARLKERFGLRIVEDCAQAIGATSRGEPAGRVGELAATSFYPTKNLGTMGDGGAVLTADPALAERSRCLRDYGQRRKYQHGELGMNSRLDELQAAILHDALLPRLEAWTARRRRIAERYREGIRNMRLHLPPRPEGSGSVWHLFPVLVAGVRESFRSFLAGRGVQTGVHYPFVIPDQEAMGQVPGSVSLDELTMARRYAAGEVSLPIHPHMDDEQVERVVAAASAWR